MTNLYDALLGEGQSQNDYTAADPYFQMGASIHAAPPPRYMGKSAMWGSALENLLGGALRGYGMENAKDTAYQDYKTNPLLQVLGKQQQDALHTTGLDTTSDELAAAKLHDYLSPTRPEGWSPNIGKRDLTQALMGMQQQQELAQKINEAKLKAQMEVATRTAQLPTFEEEQKIKGKYNPSGAKIDINQGLGKNLPAATVEKIAQGKAIIDHSMGLADQIEKTYAGDTGAKGWLKLQGAKNISALDEKGLMSNVRNLVDLVVRERSGANAPEKEKNDMRAFVAGDMSVSPKQVSEFLRRFAKMEAGTARSELDLGEQMAAGDLSKFKSSLQSVLSSGGANVIKPRTPDDLIAQGYHKVPGGWSK